MTTAARSRSAPMPEHLGLVSVEAADADQSRRVLAEAILAHLDDPDG